MLLHWVYVIYLATSEVHSSAQSCAVEMAALERHTDLIIVTIHIDYTETPYTVFCRKLPSEVRSDTRCTHFDRLHWWYSVSNWTIVIACWLIFRFWCACPAQLMCEKLLWAILLETSLQRGHYFAPHWKADIFSCETPPYLSFPEWPGLFPCRSTNTHTRPCILMLWHTTQQATSLSRDTCWCTHKTWTHWEKFAHTYRIHKRSLSPLSLVTARERRETWALAVRMPRCRLTDIITTTIVKTYPSLLLLCFTPSSSPLLLFPLTTPVSPSSTTSLHQRHSYPLGPNHYLF